MPYDILLLPIIAGLISQLLKLMVKPNKRAMNLSSLIAYSGMPSSHSAMVISLATIIALEQGLASPIFGLTVIFAIIIIRDALGLRRYLGQHGKILNVLVKDLKDDQVLDEKYPHLIENIGHTPAQVIVGGLLGFIISFAGFYFF